jgi:hypothetical protein
MKTLLTLSTMTLFFNCFSQLKVYNSSGNMVPYKKEDLDIEFSPGNVTTIPTSDGTKDTTGFSPGSVVKDILEPTFKLTANFLEGRIKKYTGEYQLKKSNLNAGDKKIPDVTFIRMVKTDEGDTVALKIVLRAKEIEGTHSFVYYVASTEVNYSKAFYKAKHYALDYSIEVIPVFLVDGKEKSETPNPICITGVKFGTINYDANTAKYRTTYIPIIDNALFMGVGIKIVETNPVKVKLETILNAINIYKDPTLEILKKLFSDK